MHSIPVGLIPLLRQALTTQGFPSNAVTDGGDIDPAALLSGAFDTLEFRTNASPPITVKVADLSSGAQPRTPNPLVKWLQPTVVLTSRAGRSVIAPHGEAGNGTWTAAALVVGLLGVGFLLGHITAKK